jgi:DNA repair exonuclease SbcCD nuclease subunit
MLLGIFSDSHLGFEGDDRYEESFLRFKESLEIFKQNKVDYLLHAGDLFDEAVPDQEVWLKTFDCFSHNNGPTCEVKKFEFSGEKSAIVKGTPIIAIHGTHEFRGKDFANALDVLEKSNCLVHLHAGYVELEKNGEKVYVHGLGGVPEKNAKAVLEKYSPKPINACCNLLLLHQSFTEFLPFDDDSIASLSLTDLPNGFDLIVDGHLHWRDEQNLQGKRFLLTGSSIFTQMKNLESERDKGVFLFETKSRQLTFIPFKNQRKLFYFRIKFDNAKPEDVMQQVNKKVSEILSDSFELKPLIRFKLIGSIAKGFSQSDISFDFSDYENRAVFSISKNFSVESFKKKIETLKEAQLQKKSVVDVGVDLLEKNVDEAGLEEFDTRRMFDLLSIGENDKAELVLLNPKGDVVD